MRKAVKTGKLIQREESSVQGAVKTKTANLEPMQIRHGMSGNGGYSAMLMKCEQVTAGQKGVCLK